MVPAGNPVHLAASAEKILGRWRCPRDTRTRSDGDIIGRCAAAASLGKAPGFGPVKYASTRSIKPKPTRARPRMCPALDEPVCGAPLTERYRVIQRCATAMHAPALRGPRRIEQSVQHATYRCWRPSGVVSRLAS